MRSVISNRIASVSIALCTALTLTACQSAADPNQTSESATTAAAQSDSAITLPQGPYTIETNDGPVELDEFPQRIVTLDLTALDVIDSLGLGDYVVATAGADGEIPEFVNNYEVLPGGQREPSYEMIASLQPDLIIGGPRNIERDPQIRTTLESIAPTVNLGVPFRNYNMEENFRVVRNVASIFGDDATAAAEEQIGALQEQADDIKSRAEGSDRARALVLMTTGGEINLFGPGSRWGLPFSDLGFDEAVALNDGGERNAQKVSFELIAEADPETLFVLDRDAAIGQAGTNVEATLDNDLIKETTAAKQDRIIPLNPSYWLLVNGGLNSFKAMLDDVDKALD